MKEIRTVKQCIKIGSEVHVIEEHSKEEVSNWVKDYQNIERTGCRR